MTSVTESQNICETVCETRCAYLAERVGFDNKIIFYRVCLIFFLFERYKSKELISRFEPPVKYQKSSSRLRLPQYKLN